MRKGRIILRHAHGCAQVMCADYGFRSGNMRLYQDEYGSVPGSAFALVRCC